MGLKNLICANGVMIACYVIDALLILGALGLFLWYYIKNSNIKKTNTKDHTTKADLNSGIEKINDDTYLVASDEDEAVLEEPVQKDNVVEHFANQITDINEETNNELNANTIVVSHEVEQPVKKVPKKDEIENFVMIGGVKKAKIENSEAVNRGTNAFKNATNFLNTIKEEQTEKEKNTKKKATK